eukprot:Filipodium_phascolosomae@DN8171_c0_g1_i1.p1
MVAIRTIVAASVLSFVLYGSTLVDATTANGEVFYTNLKGDGRDAEILITMSEVEAGKHGWIHVELHNDYKWTSLSLYSDFPAGSKYTSGLNDLELSPSQISEFHIKPGGDMENFTYSVFGKLNVPASAERFAIKVKYFNNEKRQESSSTSNAVQPVDASKYSITAGLGTVTAGEETFAGVNFDFKEKPVLGPGSTLNVQIRTRMNQTVARSYESKNYRVENYDMYILMAVTEDGVPTSCWQKGVTGEAAENCAKMNTESSKGVVTSARVAGKDTKAGGSVLVMPYKVQNYHITGKPTLWVSAYDGAATELTGLFIGPGQDDKYKSSAHPTFGGGGVFLALLLATISYFYNILML